MSDNRRGVALGIVRSAATGMRPVLLVALALSLGLGGCSQAGRDLRRGERDYQAGRFREAHQAFSRALARRGDPALQFPTGNALYRLRRYDEAARSFREAAGVSRLRQKSYYNLGNAYVRAAEEAAEPDQLLRQAIAAYEEALRLAPKDSAAKWNLEIALRRRGEDRESGGSPGRGRSADYGRGDMDDPGYEGNSEASVGAMAGGGYGSAEGESAEELSESQARQLLETVEREQLQSHQGRPSMGGGSREKDW
jgi:tetratricopeptide (TPR) repeat protein